MTAKDTVPVQATAPRVILPHDDAPLWVWHAWLCHGSSTDGSQGEPCPDGCEGEYVDPMRLQALEESR